MRSERRIELNYRGLDITGVLIKDISDEYEVRTMSFIKAQAVRKNVLGKIPLEDMLGLSDVGPELSYDISPDMVSKARPAKTKPNTTTQHHTSQHFNFEVKYVKIFPSWFGVGWLVVGWFVRFPPLQAKTARQQFSHALADAEVKDSEHLIIVTNEVAKQLCGNDPTFVMEVGLVHTLAGEGATSRISKVLLGMFPTAEHKMSIDQTETLVRAFISSEGFRFVPAALATASRYALTLTGSISKKSTQDMKVTQLSKLVRELWGRCVFFCG